MVSVSQEDVLRNTRTVLQGLEALREDHAAIRIGLNANVGAEEAQLVVEKKSIVASNIDKISHAIEDAQMMLALTVHLQSLETEKQQLRAQAECAESKARRIAQENSWLRDEMGRVVAKYEESAKLVIQLEEDNKQLVFMNSLKQYDDDHSEAVINKAPAPAAISDSTLQLQEELGFGPDEDDEGGYARPAAANGGHEMSARFRTIHKMVNDYASQGQFHVAVPLCKQAIEELQQESPGSLDVATMLNVLAMLYRDQKKFKEAIAALSEALTVREKCLGENHPNVAHSLNNLAVLHGKLGKFDQAEPLCKRALEIKEKILGKDHPEVAKQLNNLAHLCLNQGRFEEVERYYKRALEIYEMKLGQDDPAVAKTMNNLSSAYLKQKKYKEAESIYKQILTRAHEREFGKIDDKSKPIWQIAEQREDAKSRGEQPSQETGDWHKAASADRPTVVSTLKHLGELYRQQGKYEAADTLEDVALRAKKQGTTVIRRCAGGQMHDSMTSLTIPPDPSGSFRMTSSISQSNIKSKIMNVFGMNSNGKQ